MQNYLDNNGIDSSTVPTTPLGTKQPRRRAYDGLTLFYLLTQNEINNNNTLIPQKSSDGFIDYSQFVTHQSRQIPFN